MTTEIHIKIKNEFHPDATAFIGSIMEKIFQNEWGVEKEQLALSLLKLSQGSIDKLLSYFPIVDPRDIIMEAE